MFTDLHDFTGSSDEGFPQNAPIQAKDGKFYGVAGGANRFTSVAYSITSSGALIPLFRFSNAALDGSDVQAGLIQGSDGAFYGAANLGGATNQGAVFKISPAGRLTLLRRLAPADGVNPQYSLLQAADGNFYGATTFGVPDEDGNFCSGGQCGGIFKITPGGAFTVLHGFEQPGFTTPNDGNGGNCSLVQATDGNFFGGDFNAGTIYKITTTGVFTVVHQFHPAANGQAPWSPLIQHTNGLLYSFTRAGGTHDLGRVFYSLNIGARPFAKLEITAGTVGTKVGIFGQGFVGANGVTSAASRPRSLPLETAI